MCKTCQVIHIAFLLAKDCGEIINYPKQVHTISPKKNVDKTYQQIHTAFAVKMWIKCYLLSDKPITSG